MHVSARITFIHVFIRSSNKWISYILSRLLITSRLYWNQHKDQLPVGLLAQLVERCTSITEIMGSNHVQAWIFFRPYFHYCSSSAHYCEDHFHSRKESLLWQNQHSKNNIYLRVAVSFNTHLKVFRVGVRQTGEQDLTTNFKRELFMSEVQPIKVKKKRK